MKKFMRKFRHSIRQIKVLLNSDDYISLLKYILFLINKNIEITLNKINGGKNNLILESTPCKRGDVFLVDFGFGIGSEFRYAHYCVIMAVEYNYAIVIPFTSKQKNSKLVEDLGIISKLQISPKIQKNSYALIYAIRSVSRARLIRPKIKGKKIYVKLNAPQMTKIDNNIKTNITY